MLEPDDLRRFGIDADRLAGALAASAGLPAVASQIADGLWLLGRVPSGRCLVLCVDVCGSMRRALSWRSDRRPEPRRSRPSLARST